jgi:glycosyltransferase involved in cell wall biosynthesis
VNLPAWVVLRLLGVRIVMRLGTAPDRTPFYRRLWKYVMNPLVDEFVVNSRFTQKEVLENGISAGKVRHIYNAVPTRSASATVQPQKFANRIIYVGQIIPEKGVDLLLDAVKLLVRRGHSNVHLDCVGQMDGWESPTYRGYRQSLREKAAEPDLQGRVSFLGVREDVPELLSRATVHCCPSRPEQRESFGNVNVEAKAAGIPSVVFPTGALPEIVTHCADGWVCTDCSAEALADGIEYFLKCPERAEAAGIAAKASLKQFSRGPFAKAWLSVLSCLNADEQSPWPTGFYGIPRKNDDAEDSFGERRSLVCGVSDTSKRSTCDSGTELLEQAIVARLQ